MGRHFEVRAKAMQATAKKKSAINMRGSKEVYMAAKAGSPDPNSNLALRSVIEKHKSLGVPNDVIERAIKKAAGGSAEIYIPGRYEAYGPGNCYLIVDTLATNVTRAFAEVRSTITKRGGHMGSVIYNFDEYGNLVFKTSASKDEVEELLILSDVDLKEIIDLGDGIIQCLVDPTDFAKARDIIKETYSVPEFELNQIMLIPQSTMTIDDPEDKEKFIQLLDLLDDLEDVQEVYHNVELD